MNRHPDEEWQRYTTRGQLPHSPCFSELDKSAQGSSVILCVAAEGDLSFSDKGLRPPQRSLLPSPGIYVNGRHCERGLPGYATERKGPHNQRIESAAFHFQPEDVREMQPVSRQRAAVRPAPRFHRLVCFNTADEGDEAESAAGGCGNPRASKKKVNHFTWKQRTFQRSLRMTLLDHRASQCYRQSGGGSTASRPAALVSGGGNSHSLASKEYRTKHDVTDRRLASELNRTPRAPRSQIRRVTAKSKDSREDEETQFHLLFALVHRNFALCDSYQIKALMSITAAVSLLQVCCCTFFLIKRAEVRRWSECGCNPRCVKDEQLFFKELTDLSRSLGTQHDMSCELQRGSQFKY